MQQSQQVQEYVLRISRIIDETPNVKAFRVEVPHGASIEFLPGQFFMVSFADDPEIKVSRAYSIASSPLDKGHLEIALDKVGPFTTKLFAMKEGGLLKFKGPYGKFCFNEEIKNNLVLIAGGTGITPLMGIIRYCNGKKLNNKIKLIYSVRTPSDVIYKNELEHIKKSNGNFDYVVAITRAEEHHGWHGRRGRVDLDLLKENVKDIGNSIYFLCGPNEFVHSVIEMLENLGVRKEQIKTDVWG